ncbi:MAG: hypothetical protein HZC38_11535 [Chloroflexi bacterium]|nr:hypothetical protein [Chloroflexota bacterium]
MVHGLQAKYEDKIQFTYLDIDDPNTRSFKHALGYRAQPHFFLLDTNGKTVKEWLGFVQESDLETAFGAFK